MDLVIDTSALIAVIVGEPERDAIVSVTSGQTLIGPGSIPWEVGNAFTAMVKQRRINPSLTKEPAIWGILPPFWPKITRKLLIRGWRS